MALLFHSNASLLDAYVGLLHFATQAGRMQAFEEAAVQHAVLGAGIVERWSRSVDVWDRKALQKLGRYLAEESTKPESRAAIAITASLQILDQALAREALQAHNEVVSLPIDLPFNGARYRLLGPPQAPILDWIEGAAGWREIPREDSDFRINLSETLNLQWRIFPVDPNPFQVEVMFEKLPAHVASMLAIQVDQRQLTLGVVSPINGLGYEVQSYPDEVHAQRGTPYRFKDLKGDRGVAERELVEVLERCRKLEIDVLMYPELTLDMGLLGHLRNELSLSNDAGFPAMVVAGSFHEEAADDAGHYVNRARVFDHLGEEILRHDKLKGFRMTRSDISGISEAERQPFLECFGVAPESGGHERIRQGRELRIVDGPLGRMVTSICLDFCGTSIHELAKESRSNLFWVPAMSSSLKKFQERARDLGVSCRATTIVVNSEWLLEMAGVAEEHREPLRSFCYLPYRGSKLDWFQADKKLSSLRLFKIGEIFEVPGDGN